ncbi:tRNA synthetases class I (C) catalytic domain-containing protein [Lineolata rhizophorae]|uniref:cysteine--tRNA ligase n=1 Tax=Lineolata rhizophorae TaxID=578093 RepID=A0A6A6NV09_9PEZI|nr:tRNA synthetases class I (C) catalytic domain-containing protein [Lineolata rhizophorae]
MASSATGRTQPPWEQPPPPQEGVKLPPLKIYNSLTRSKNPFYPIDQQGKRVAWYACGPTVYDDAHLGHARNYVSTDILRRILKDYFKFELKFVMNITDIDDKIILRGRQQHLLSQFKEKHPKLDGEVYDAVTKAFEAYIRKNLPLLPESTTPESYPAESKNAYGRVLAGKALESDDGKPGDKEAKIKMHLKTCDTASKALASHKSFSQTPETFYAQTEDVLFPYLDSLHGSTVDSQDHGVWTRLTQRYEQRFMDDVRALNCLDPDVVTRVTEYGPAIVDFVRKIVDNGFAYATSDGSVYFDIDAFERAGNSYARLEPWNRGDKDLQADGEGALSAAKRSSEKRSDADFALWKSSKPGEPAWPSPWGPGRPGWHIECSAMASDVLGARVDIHSGGVDLAFPHHDNELAQSEAFWLETAAKGGAQHKPHQWVNYFVHMGHLSIAGSKMSKSLKNFTTIREALARGDWTPRSLRVVFLLGGWKDGVEITDDLVKAGQAWEEKVTNFLLKAKDLARELGDKAPAPATAEGEDPFAVPRDPDDPIAEPLQRTRDAVFAALADSFDTPAAMRLLSSLVTDANAAPHGAVPAATTLALARYLTHMVAVFGLDGTADPADASRIGWAGIDIPAEAEAWVYPLSRMRDTVRRAARNYAKEPTKVAEEARGAVASADEVATSQTKTTATENGSAEANSFEKVFRDFKDEVAGLASETASPAKYLSACDRVRDVGLWDCGVYLEDRDQTAQPALVRPVTVDLRAQREAKETVAREKAAARERREKEEAEKARKREESARVDPRVMFKEGDAAAEFEAWDEEGLPVRLKGGEEVSKSRKKKLVKEWEKQKKAFEEWKKGQGKA